MRVLEAIYIFFNFPSFCTLKKLVEQFLLDLSTLLLVVHGLCRSRYTQLETSCLCVVQIVGIVIDAFTLVAILHDCHIVSTGCLQRTVIM